MSLSAGTRLGPYEILAPLGRGGMGEVYRAKDTKLEREVAIKVLPNAVARDPERLARFEREAKILASLNHPNIAHIYGIEDSPSGRALAMELVEGTTLQRSYEGVAALKIAVQIADALEAAHEKGVTHRDLKPANVMVTPDGVVKVLDFGLASVARPTESVDPNDSPTLTMSMTQAGAILGTAGYMSPEQASGKPVDKRSDIWSFGVVLFEMLSGEKLFAGGETIVHTLADVLRAPIDFEKLPETTPRVVREILRRCLDREPRTRLRDIGEARVAMQGWLANPIADKLPAERAVEVRTTRHSTVVVAAAALLGVLAAGAAFLYLREAPPEALTIEAALLPPDGTEFTAGTKVATPAISPDGTRIVFAAKTKDGKELLWLRRLDSSTAQPLAGTEDAGRPFWSPDSRWIGFAQNALALKKIDIEGGPPVTITSLPGNYGGASWNADGVIIFGLGNGSVPIMQVPAAGGQAVPATTIGKDEDGASHRHPFFLPDGRHFLYMNAQLGDMPILVGSLDEPGQPGKLVTQAHSQAAYADGHLLYLRENTLMAQPFDLKQLATTGEAVPVAEGIPTLTSPTRVAPFTVSTTGLLVYQNGATGTQSRLVWKDRTGKVLANVGEPTGLIQSLSLSPDEKRAAVTIRDNKSVEDIWIFDVLRGVRSRLTFDAKRDVDPVWSPDGRMIYFDSNRKKDTYFDLYRKPSDGSGAEELVLESPTNKTPGSISSDGKWLLFSQAQTTASASGDIWALPLFPGGGQPRAFLETPYLKSNPKLSADGQWVAYGSNESGQFQIYAAPFPGPGGKFQISPGVGTGARWLRDGGEIFYMAPGGVLMAAEIRTRNGSLEVGRVEKLFDGLLRGATYDVSTDGQRFLVVDNGAEGTGRPLTLRQNWTVGLK